MALARRGSYRTLRHLGYFVALCGTCGTLRHSRGICGTQRHFAVRYAGTYRMLQFFGYFAVHYSTILCGAVQYSATLAVLWVLWSLCGSLGACGTFRYSTGVVRAPVVLCGTLRFLGTLWCSLCLRCYFGRFAAATLRTLFRPWAWVVLYGTLRAPVMLSGTLRFCALWALVVFSVLWVVQWLCGSFLWQWWTLCSSLRYVGALQLCNTLGGFATFFGRADASGLSVQPCS